MLGWLLNCLDRVCFVERVDAVDVVPALLCELAAVGLHPAFRHQNPEVSTFVEVGARARDAQEERFVVID